MNRILVIASPSEGDSLGRFMRLEGYVVDVPANCTRSRECFSWCEFDLVIIDLPPISEAEVGGFELLRRIRQSSLLPVLMISESQDDAERVLALELGADDYLHKPYLLQELLARIRAILRRAGAGVSAFHHLLKVSDFELDRLKRKVRRSGEEISLTAAEFDLFELLLKRVGQVVTREEIAQTILGRSLSHNDRSIDMHISNLRRKLGARDRERGFIKSIRGAGYSFTIS